MSKPSNAKKRVNLIVEKFEEKLAGKRPTDSDIQGVPVIRDTDHSVCEFCGEKKELRFGMCFDCFKAAGGPGCKGIGDD